MNPTHLEVPLPPGYRRREVLDFYGRDAESVSERIFVDGLDKAVLVDGEAALVSIRFESGSAWYEGGSRQIVERILGLDSEASQFEEQFQSDPLLGPLIERQRGLRIPLTPEPWEALAWAILGQQITVRLAVALRRALILGFGPLHESGLRAHPSPETVAALDLDALRALKFSRSKAEYLIAAAQAVVDGALPLDDLFHLPPAHGERLLRNVRGIGPWTIQYVFLRGFGFADCLPAGDAGLAQGLERLTGERPTEARIRQLMAPYAPYRSLATYHVWASLR